MKENKFLVHCGFAKCGSTAFQELFSRSNINYLGFYPEARPKNFYINDSISSFFEQTLRFGSNKNFGENFLGVRDFLQMVKEKESRHVIISNENIMGRYSLCDLPDEIKISRLMKVIPNKSVILIVFRKLENLLFSYYKLLVSFGYVGTPEYFFDELNLFGEVSGFWEGFDLETIYEKINYSSPSDNQHVICSVDLENIGGIKNILSAFDISSNLKKVNESLELLDLDYHLGVNSGLFAGKRFLDWFEIHRVFPQSRFEENDIFRLSRTRHTHENIKKHIPSNNTNSNIEKSFYDNMPQKVLELSNKNKSFSEKRLEKVITNLDS